MTDQSSSNHVSTVEHGPWQGFACYFDLCMNRPLVKLLEQILAASTMHRFPLL